MLKERYYSTVEYADRYGKTNKELHLYCEIGKKPTIGDFIEAFQKIGLDLELNDFVNLTFKPRRPLASTVISVKVLRTIKDHTYRPTGSDMEASHRTGTR
ncbi:hypothetical protein FE784_29225 [Paenibacillus hemerocallicola]|uniref:Uncharacterized protein n=1 Tax=Paenibacillus hemerocallicola TaxID=1172614 RepID=A0A5C4T1A7_9BACL|nr:hypothetical protein [Paenibacillus hemerocallicola]TNJ62726.1 hypothetical protein FE784_29225 [Paenibacillus hemerocallicola]